MKTTFSKSAFGVDREDDAGRGQVRPHHFHHADRVEHLEVIEAIVDAIADGAVGEQAREAMTDGVENRRGAAHVEIGVMLAGETRARQIFGRRRRAHRDRQIGAIFLREAGQRVANVGLEIGRRLRAVDNLAGERGPLCEIVDVRRI